MQYASLIEHGYGRTACPAIPAGFSRLTAGTPALTASNPPVDLGLSARSALHPRSTAIQKSPKLKISTISSCVCVSRCPSRRWCIVIRNMSPLTARMATDVCVRWNTWKNETKSDTTCAMKSAAATEATERIGWSRKRDMGVTVVEPSIIGCLNKLTMEPRGNHAQNTQSRIQCS